MADFANISGPEMATLERKAGLQIYLFGAFQAVLNGELLRAFDSDKARALLAYLAVEAGEPHRREKLAGLLWPEMPEKRARASLSQALYNLRALLGDHQATIPFLGVSHTTIQFNTINDIWLDSGAFTNLIEEVARHNHRSLESCDSCIERLQEAVSLYRGEFLTGFYVDGAQAFQEWCSLAGERFQRQAIAVLKQLARAFEGRGEIEQALECVHWLVELDPYAEAPQRLLMRLLDTDGQRTAALAGYESHRHTLMAELDVEPAPETTALYEQIRDAQTETTPSQEPLFNLPADLTPFIGREKEIESLDVLLQDPAIRLITIVGPGGVGKTRLAIACAQRQLVNGNSHPFIDGAVFVPLAGIDTADQILSEIAKALNLTVINTGMAGQASSGIDQRLIDFLSSKRMLLVLDNFEQLLDATHSITKLLQIAPEICILITSRQRLHLKGEQVFPIGGLTYPLLESLEDPWSYTAIELFMNSARRLQPEFDLKQENYFHLVNICRMLDGLPLGMELAASWSELLSIEEIGAEIQRNIGFLKSDWGDLPERHHSLLAVCDTTWQLMKPSEQDLFARLSVFRGGFTLPAAHKVAKASIRDLQALRRKSMLGYDPINRRYRIHPYLRQYGLERLFANPDNEFQARDLHSAFFCAEIKTNNDTYEAGYLQIAVDQMETEFANIQMAWDWAVAHGNLEQIDQGILGLCHFLLYHVRFDEALTLCKFVNEKLASQTTISSPDAKLPKDNYLHERVHGKVINYQGYFSTFFDEDQAAPLYDESLEKFNQLEMAGYDVRLEKAQVLILKSGRGAGARYHTNPQSSKALLLESLVLLQETENYWWTFFGLVRLGETCSEIGSHQEAKNWFKQGYDLAKKVHNQHHEVYFLEKLGYASRNSCDYDAAINYYKKARSLAISYHRHGWVIGILDSLGSLSLFLGRLGEAAANYKQAISIAEEKLSIRDASAPLTNLSVTQWLTGAFEESEKTMLTAVDFSQKLSDFGVFWPNSGYIQLLALTGRYHEVAEKIEWVNECLAVSGWPYISCQLSRVLGWLSLVDHRYTAARAHFEASIDCLPSDAESIAWSQAGLAGAEFGLGHRDETRNLLTKALCTSIQIQCYIPMVFTLPMTLLILAEEDPELAIYVYLQVKSDPFLSVAPLIEDLVYKNLPDEIMGIPEVKIGGGPERQEALWETANLIHEKWANEG